MSRCRVLVPDGQWLLVDSVGPYQDHSGEPDKLLLLVELQPTLLTSPAF